MSPAGRLMVSMLAPQETAVLGYSRDFRREDLWGMQVLWYLAVRVSSGSRSSLLPGQLQCLEFSATLFYHVLLHVFLATMDQNPPKPRAKVILSACNLFPSGIWVRVRQSEQS